jgi:hypothetical protein
MEGLGLLEELVPFEGSGSVLHLSLSVRLRRLIPFWFEICNKYEINSAVYIKT